MNSQMISRGFPLVPILSTHLMVSIRSMLSFSSPQCEVVSCVWLLQIILLLNLEVIFHRNVFM